MKVLAVIIATPLRKVSGATKAAEELSEATADLIDLELAQMWDEPEIVRGTMLRRRFRSRHPLGPLARFAPRAVLTPLYDSGIPTLIQRGRYDLVHLHNLIPTFAALRVARACRRQRIPYVVSTHGFVEIVDYAKLNGFGALRSLLIRILITIPFHRIVKGADRLLALSDREYDLLQGLGIPRDRVDIVTNGVSERYLLDPPAADVERMRSRWAPDDLPIVLFMGSLHAYKGVGVLLAALTQIDAPFQAVIAGRFNDPEQADRLIREAGVSPELATRIRFTGGIEDDDLQALYALADVFVYPTSGDTLPLVVLEAMASRCAVVSTTVGGIPFEVTPDCGVLVPPGDPVAVAVATEALLRDPDRRHAMGDAARARVGQEFRWERSAQAAVAAYERVLGREA